MGEHTLRCITDNPKDGLTPQQAKGPLQNKTSKGEVDITQHVGAEKSLH